MRLGIDLGTTRTVVAVADRGNFPIVTFTTPEGDVLDHYPTVSAVVDGELVHGPHAVAHAREGAPSLASWKRLLGEPNARQRVTIGDVEVSLAELVTSFLRSLRSDLVEGSNLSREEDEDAPLEAVVSVPANAHSTQRFVTLEAFRRAGFVVRGMLNEPSAAGLEYAHRHERTITAAREHVVIYDLGGGTFDTALLSMASGGHDVVATSGVSRLGGDDFDAALLDLVLETASIDAPLTAEVRAALLLECRLAKEALNPSSRRLVVDLSALDPEREAVTVTVAAFYERVRPLVERSMASLDPVLRAESTDGESVDVSDADLAGIYVVGGGSGLPLVPRVLRERFGRRVHRSPYPSAATAIGCAIAAAIDATLPVAEQFTRHLGVFREERAGTSVSFDRIFAKGTAMPAEGQAPLTETRVYRAAHDLGHFRFIECAELGSAGGPSGDISPHAEILFPFLPALRGQVLTDRPTERLASPGPRIEERYEVDASGVIAVTITDLDAGYSERHVL